MYSVPSLGFFHVPAKRPTGRALKMKLMQPALRLLPFVFAALLCGQSFTPSFMDRKVDPCSDFYEYACGGWRAANPVPAQYSRWSRFEELAERNRRQLREILEAAAAAPARNPIEQKIGDYYASCMDEEAIEKAGLARLKPELDRVEALPAIDALAPLLGHLHQIGAGAAFAFGPQADLKNSTEMIAVAAQGGLALPDREYYLKKDEKSLQLLARYQEHIERMFRLAGVAEQTAKSRAQAVLEIETSLAAVSLDRVTRRDPYKNYNKLTRTELTKLTPSFDWNRYFEARSTPAFESLNVQNPQFFSNLETLLGARSLEDWKAYLSWNLLRLAAPMLPKAFDQENFDFFGRILTGQKEQLPRWQRCVAAVDADLGEALGQKYVEKYFPPQARGRMLEMVAAIERAMEADLSTLEWMTPETRRRALEKLHAVANKIGHPEKWRDYSGLEIVRGDALGNSLRANRFESAYQLSKIGGKVDPSEWSMTPPTVNAYYSPTMNNINFPAGIFQPPFFDNAADDAVNFGAIGAVIAHELTHGFDDQGRKYDARGNLADWWTELDAREFERRSECFVQQYGEYTAVSDIKLNGRLTLGENVADNGGVRLAYMALQEILKGKSVQPADGFTPDQRFFLSWAQIWCQNITEERARVLAATDPHSPGRYRVNGVVSNMPEFRAAFGCAPDKPMVRANACRVW